MIAILTDFSSIPSHKYLWANREIFKLYLHWWELFQISIWKSGRSLKVLDVKKISKSFNDMKSFSFRVYNYMEAFLKQQEKEYYEYSLEIWIALPRFVNSFFLIIHSCTTNLVPTNCFIYSKRNSNKNSKSLDIFK